MTTRLGVDVGGTFTDLITYDDETGEVRVAKTATTPAAPEQGILNAVAEAVPAALLGGARYFLHGTTVGLNALLERKGPVLGLLATRGFRDVLELRRGDRDEMYNLFWAPPPPLVPRRLRLPVTERLRADGAVHTPIDLEDVRRALEVFRSEGVTSIAVAFLHAYANPAHELAAERALRDLGFSGEISLSHAVSGEYREYERTSTTVIDAFVRPRMSGYLRHLEERLREVGFGGDLLITRSGGGAMTFAEAETRPFETIMSGPVAGAEGTAELARRLGLGLAIAADVGGTSFDTCLIAGGRPRVLYQGSVAGLPVQTPWVDVRSIGAGGGSIAYVDAGGLLRVGPRSAGADPGPACYGRGGTEPAATDAAAVLGMLGEGALAGGIILDMEQARAALDPLAHALGLTAEDTARGVLTILGAAMASAIREITVEQGIDPREATLVAFGGAGSLFATLLARELEIGSVAVPPYAGNFSAWGLLGADITRTGARTRIMRLDDAAVVEANRILAALFADLEARGGGAPGVAGHGTGAQREVGLDMRYVGQEHTLTIPVAAEGGRMMLDAAAIGEAFSQAYGIAFGHGMDEAIEIVSLRATLRTPLPRRAREHLTRAERAGAGPRSWRAYSFTRQDWLPFAVVERTALAVGASLPGPAIILEETATTYLDAGFVVSVHPSGTLMLTYSSEV